MGLARLTFLAALGFVAIGAGVTGVLLLRTYIVRDSRFRIAGAANIQSTGLTEVSRAELLPVFGEDIGRNIFFVPLEQRRQELEKIPWVEHATVMRLLPDRIRVSIVERQPVAFVRQGDKVGLVDANGVLLTMSESTMLQHHYSFPVISGVEAREPLEKRAARMAVYERMLAELDGGGQRLSEQISEVDLSDPEDARVLMPEKGADVLAHFGQDRFLERYQRYRANIAQWRAQYPQLSAVDLRYDGQVVLKMNHGGSRVEAPTGADSALAGVASPASADGSQAAQGMNLSAVSDAGKQAGSASSKSKPSAARSRSAKENRKRAEAPHKRTIGISQPKQKLTAAIHAGAATRGE